VRAALPHGGKALVSRRVDEGGRARRARVDDERRDALRDAARLLCRDRAAAERVEQRGLAVVYVAHQRHHRRSQRLLRALVRRRRRAAARVHVVQLQREAAF
jgi:hypothetical protein